MNYEEAVELTNRFPRDRTVPGKLAKAIEESTGKEKELLGELVEGLIISCKNFSDYDLVYKYFEQLYFALDGFFLNN